MPQYTVSSVLYARVTDANIAIASLNSGGTSESVIEEVITAPTLATGKISTTGGSQTVSGTQTDFINDFADGQYLYYYNSDGSATLLGQIQSRTTATTMTLVEDTLYEVTNKNAGGAGIKLTGGENILLRVPVIPREFTTGGVVTQAIIPNLNEWRTPNSSAAENSINNPSTSAIIRYSNPGDIVSVDTTSTDDEKNVPFTIVNLNVFTNGTIAKTFWSSGNIPNYIWFLINPYGRSGTNMAQSTMFKLFTKIQFTNGVSVGINTPESTLTTAGYNLNF